MRNLIIGGAYYLFAVVLAVQIVAHSEAAKVEYEQAYAHFTPGKRADARLRGWLEGLTLGFYRGATEHDNELATIIALAKHHEVAATRAAWGLLALSMVQIIMSAARGRYFTTRWIARSLVIQLLGVSLIFLGVGLLAPILSFVAYTDVAVLGKVVFKYEAKGILTSVRELLNSGNIFIAVLLFVFSVVTPAVKHLFSFMALTTEDRARSRRYIGWVAAIGKWSMADVLVVAVLLSFFVSRSEEFTDSWLGQGLYFFAGYCLLSLVAVQCMSLIHTRETKYDG